MFKASFMFPQLDLCQEVVDGGGDEDNANPDPPEMGICVLNYKKGKWQLTSVRPLMNKDQ